MSRQETSVDSRIPGVWARGALLAAIAALSLTPSAVAEPVATQVLSGNTFACALTSAGGVKCWGYGGNGQLGDGTNQQRARPVDVVGLTGGVARIAVGGDHVCALTNSGSVLCWGFNGSGQLGDGTTLQRNTPVAVSGLGAGVASIAAGAAQTCALMATGGVKCWGSNANGQLGDNTTTARTSPVDVTGLANGVRDISAGGGHTCALIAGGSIKCWGANALGQLGDGTTVQRNTPVDVTGVTNAERISVGGQHTCAQTAGGGLACWGSNGIGQLGDGTTINRSTPTGVSGFGDIATGVSAGPEHTCATASSGAIRCWGSNADGRLGDGTFVHRPLPVSVLGLSGSAASVAAGGSHSCALTETGGAQCWGSNMFFQLGRGDTSGDQKRALDVVGLTSGWRRVDGGRYHTCAEGTGGELKCWGDNIDGQLGNGNQVTQLSPVASAGDAHYASTSTGGYHTCSVQNGSPSCWGYNGLGGRR